MSGLLKLFRKLGLRKNEEALSSEEAERLRGAFRARYHHFRMLLSANNKALEIMSDLEQAARGKRPFGMSFVRSNCTAVLVNVFRIIQNLDQLAPGKYQGLFPKFEEIQEKINRILSQKKDSREGSLVVPLSLVDRGMSDLVGSKMANIGEICNRLDIRVPSGFVITSRAYQRFFEANDLQTEIERRLQSAEAVELDQLYSLSADIQQLIIRSPVPDDIEQAIAEAYRDLERVAGAGVKVSMRSSALGEDSAETSFAGQYRSELNVSSENLTQAYKEIIASKYTLQAISYRLNRGILDEEVAMCVGCMAMVSAVSGGVMYSRNPLNIRDDSISIHAVWGLPKSVVDGSVAPDLFVLRRSASLELIERRIVTKLQQFVCFPEEGVCRMDLTGERSTDPSIDDSQARELAGLALKLEEYYGSAQDIEWAIDPNGWIYILQSRPLRQMEARVGGDDFRGDEPLPGEVLLEGGATASPGVAYGRVHIVRKNSDSLQFPKGGILVTSQALPRWAALLSRASAVICEQGSAAGHLANVAREFHVPAIFGVGGAMELLTDGEDVTVDADGMRVYRGRVEQLLVQSDEPRGLMDGSPVLGLLKEVSSHIVPLHLLDPDSAEFRPRNCRTLHDITRFCHEKSVHEMFSFGREHGFSERASKQLVCEVPMQWWLINLDDGFKSDIKGKFVHLEEIVSIPFWALWNGITAIPWAGPPPVDSRGFMSILLEASSNPAFDPSMPSPYASRNYFMVSKNFCSLSSRFGFHFSTIESLVSDRASENYISFHFKGGAADFNRRIRRVQFIAGILEEFDFRVEIKEDALFARIEGYDEKIMIEKLRILGYLIMHTRQLDMIMSNDASYREHRDKILSDLSRIVQPVLSAG